MNINTSEIFTYYLSLLPCDRDCDWWEQLPENSRVALLSVAGLDQDLQGSNWEDIHSFEQKNIIESGLSIHKSMAQLIGMLTE